MWLGAGRLFPFQHGHQMEVMRGLLRYAVNSAAQAPREALPVWGSPRSICHTAVAPCAVPAGNGGPSVPWGPSVWAPPLVLSSYLSSPSFYGTFIKCCPRSRIGPTKLVLVLWRGNFVSHVAALNDLWLLGCNPEAATVTASELHGGNVWEVLL